MAKSKLKEFRVGAIIKVWVDISISAESLSDATERAKTLEVTDFITIDGEYNDGNMKIIQVCDNEFNTDL